MSEMVLPDWVGAARERGRVPVGQVVAGCRWPVGMRERVAGGLDTLASIAAAEFPVVCLACRTPHRIDVLTDDPDPGARALDSVPCPACGTVGLWPPLRPAREIHWANRELWAVYGPTLPLPADQVVLVPELCGRDVVQRSDNGAQPTYCETAPHGGQAHVSAKADRPRARLLGAHAPAAVVAPADAAVARPALVVVPAPDSEPGETEPADAAVSGPAADGPVDQADGHAEPSAADSGVLVSSEALDAVRGELAIAARLLGDATARVTRAVARYDGLADALGRERAAFEQRTAVAEQVAADAVAELDGARTAAADAEQARLRAEGRADELAAQLTALRDGAIQQVVVTALDRFSARRTVAGERITPTQRKMIDTIGGQADAVAHDPAHGTWYIAGRKVGDGSVKTLESLHRRQLIGWTEPDAGGTATVHLAGPAVELFTARHGHPPAANEPASTSDTTTAEPVIDEPAAAGAGPATEAPAAPGAEATEAPAAEPEDEGAGAEPAAELSDVAPVPELAALENGRQPEQEAVTSVLRRVQGGGVTRGADRIWRVAGGVHATKPLMATLDWMLTQGMIRILDNDSVEPTTPF